MVFLKKYPALFLLALFVFPYLQKGAHDMAHAGDFHCQEITSKHFHALEHHCEVCDKVFSVTREPVLFKGFSSCTAEINTLLSVSVPHIELAAIRLFSLRGPPEN